MRRLLSYLLWPLLLCLCLLGTYVGTALGHPIAGFNLTYLMLAVALFYLERYFPHEEKWLVDDGQVKADLLHTLFNKGIVQVIVAVTTVLGLVEQAGHSSLELWPVQWPLPMQVVLAIIVMDFGLYWKHRLGHELDWLWPFHAVHHSAPRLWFFNTGRFHIVDTVTSLALGLPLLFLLGAPQETFSWAAGITAYIGMLTHCNVEMRFGFLSLIFNTPELHRWHHSKKLRESNSNYGENLMLWDHVFKSFFRAADRRPPVKIGISHAMPESFVRQLIHPFKKGALVSVPNAYKKMQQADTVAAAKTVDDTWTDASNTVTNNA